MKTYIGTKMLMATAMTLGAYNNLRGWEMPSDENPSREGYLVEYPLVGEDDQPNLDGYKGYVSWSPKAAFEKSYRLNGSLTFGDAIVALEEGKRVARAGWNGKGMFVFKQVPSPIPAEVVPKMTSLPDSVKEEFVRREQGPNYCSQMAIVKSDGSVDSWVASSADTFAKDWAILD